MNVKENLGVVREYENLDVDCLYKLVQIYGDPTEKIHCIGSLEEFFYVLNSGAILQFYSKGNGIKSPIIIGLEDPVEAGEVELKNHGLELKLKLEER